MSSPGIGSKLFLPHEVAKRIILDGEPASAVLDFEGGDTPSSSGSDVSDSHASDTGEETEEICASPDLETPTAGTSTQTDLVASQPPHYDTDSKDAEA